MKKRPLPDPDARINNPFHAPLVSELIEDPTRYTKLFSPKILIGEALEVFQGSNAVVVGPQGSGKSMILNLVRYNVFAEHLRHFNTPPEPLRGISPFIGISVNLVRANFHAFGRRSLSKVRGTQEEAEVTNLAAASDYLTYYLLREFLNTIVALSDKGSDNFLSWAGLRRDQIEHLTDWVYRIVRWDCWRGYFDGISSYEALHRRVTSRLLEWHDYLNANRDDVSDEVYRTKVGPGEAQHQMGNLLQSISDSISLPLFITIDQYEVLPELNLVYGKSLQRLVNTFLKARDPNVFYKIGARTHDWGEELRIWGAESRIEVQRDYVLINLFNVLMRSEDGPGLFPALAEDVAYKRIVAEGGYSATRRHVPRIFGDYSPDEEAQVYKLSKERLSQVFRGLSPLSKRRISGICGPHASCLELRLAGAWMLQQLTKNGNEGVVLRQAKLKPWNKSSWRKERVYPALLQIASIANQKKYYYGWDTIVALAGANISTFLLLCSEVWDVAAKSGIDPTANQPLSPTVQTRGVYVASEKWYSRDRGETVGGRRRHDVLGRLGPAISNAILVDFALSNPGHSGFSLLDSELNASDKGNQVRRFLENGVSWSVFEERAHTPKTRQSSRRHKYYLHPILSPVFRIPHVRSKEPLYATVAEVYNWFFSEERIVFAGTRSRIRRLLQDEDSTPSVSLNQLELYSKE